MPADPIVCYHASVTAGSKSHCPVLHKQLQFLVAFPKELLTFLELVCRIF